MTARMPQDFRTPAHALRLALAALVASAMVPALSQGTQALVVSAPSTVFVDSMKVTVSGWQPGADVRYTLDGRTPGPNSTRYTVPFEVSETTVVTVRAFRRGAQPSAPVRLRLEKVEAWAPMTPRRIEPGLTMSEFKGEWPTVRSMYGKRADSTATATAFLVEGPVEAPVGRMYEGFIRVDEDGLYGFQVRAPLGVRLWVGGQLVVDDDDGSKPGELTGWAPLGKGLHSIRLEWVGKPDSADLRVLFTLYGGDFAPIPSASLQRVPRGRRTGG